MILRALASHVCPSCGATLGVESEQLSCEFCGWSGAISQDEWQGEALSSLVIDTLRTAQIEITKLLSKGSSSTGAPAFVIAAIGISFLVATWIYPWSRFFSMLIFFVLTIALSLIGMFLGNISESFFAERRAKRMARALKLSRKNATCDSCGAPVQVPGGSAQIRCAHCDSVLLATKGLVVAWNGDAKQAKVNWLAQAEKLAKARRSIGDTFASWFIAGFFIAVPIGGFIYLFMTNPPW